MLKQIPAGLLEQIYQLADERRRRIATSGDDLVITGRRFYVSADGNDQSDGRSPATAWATLKRVNRFSFKPGDTILFRRGDIFRGALYAREGVTITAYGKGEKPRLWASPFDGAKHGKWIPTDEPDIYVYSERFLGDVGCLFFNHGEKYGLKATIDFKGRINRTDNLPFTSWRDLKEDLSFYHDLGGPHFRCTRKNGLLYLKCEGGNPAKRFKSIEFNVREHAITITGNNVHINNIHIEYCGMHGIAANTKDGLWVDWCQFDHIGGSMQFYSKGRPTRFGNAVEIYGACKDYTVEFCHVNDVYDAGLTHQFSTGENYPVIMKDVTYKGNLIENCIYSIEYFNGASSNGSTREIHHVRITDNIMLNCGYGFGQQRPDKTRDAHIKSWDSLNLGSDMVYENNIFCRSRYNMLHISSHEEACLPTFRHNLLIQDKKHPLGFLGTNGSAQLPFTSKGISAQGIAGDDNDFYTI